MIFCRKQARSADLISVCLLVGMVALAGCSTTPPAKMAAPEPALPETVAPKQPAQEVKPAASSSGAGAYLEGDGPGATTPPNLAEVPDAVPRVEPLHRYANRPYNVLGKSYAPLEKTGRYKERGIASWYGKKFHGLRTSIGEVYDMYGMSAAHPVLPIPSYARVTNLSNKKSVVVRINDRGPFLHERIIDLSYTAAYKLDLLGKGSDEVEVESLDAGAPAGGLVAGDAPASERPVLPAVAAGAGKVFLQLGSFSNKESAESFLTKIKAELGEESIKLGLFRKNGQIKVQFGPYKTAIEARSDNARLTQKLGIKPFVSVR